MHLVYFRRLLIFKYVISNVSTFFSNSNACPPLQRFVSRYGHVNGWDPINHTGFVKLRKKYGAGTEALFEACQERLLHITHQMAAEHDEWYTMYEEKATANKDAIRKWKSKKKADVTATQSLVEEEKIKTSLAEHLKKNEQNEDCIKQQKLREFKKYELALWKKEQAKQKELKDEKEREEREKQAAKLKLAALERKKERERKLLLVSENQKHQKVVVNEAKKITKERHTNNILVLALQKEREEQVLRKRQELAKKKQMQEIEKEHRLEKLKNTVCLGERSYTRKVQNG